MAYPIELTTSDWVDYLETLTTRDEKIAALATMHRRLQHQASVQTLDNLAAEDEKDQEAVVKVRDAAKGKLEVPVDFPAEDVRGELVIVRGRVVR